MAYYQKPGRGKSTPLKMAGEKMKSTSPIMKALVGNQDKLPEHLKKKILDAPEDSPVKMYGSPAKMEGDKGPLKMYKSSPLQNCPDCPKEEDKKKKEGSINTSTYKYTGERGGKLSPGYEKQRKKDLLKKSLKLAQERLNEGKFTQFQYDQFVANKKKQYQTFDD